MDILLSLCFTCKTAKTYLYNRYLMKSSRLYLRDKILRKLNSHSIHGEYEEILSGFLIYTTGSSKFTGKLKPKNDSVLSLLLELTHYDAQIRLSSLKDCIIESDLTHHIHKMSAKARSIILQDMKHLEGNLVSILIEKSKGLMHISAYLSRDYMHAFSSLCTNIFYTLGALFDNTVSTMNEQIDLRNLVTTKHTKRIILLLDFIHKDHAMFRSYAETYRNYVDDPDCQMIIALAGIHLNQSEIKDLPDIFKDQIQLTRNDGESSFLQFIKAIKDFKADELIFPAFGFSHETAILSHMRTNTVCIFGTSCNSRK